MFIEKKYSGKFEFIHLTKKVGGPHFDHACPITFVFLMALFLFNVTKFDVSVSALLKRTGKIRKKYF